MGSILRSLLFGASGVLVAYGSRLADNTGWNFLADLLWFATLILSILAAGSLLPFLQRDTSAARKTAEVLETTAESRETLVEYVEAQLKAAAARQEVAVQTAESRANRLSSVGFLLMVCSVLVPFALVYLYMTLPPTVPSAAGATPQRDWHLLLAGVSLGLLFIAAARGILLVEGRQREVYAREVRETAYYGDLRRALGMAQRLDKKRNDEGEAATEVVVRKIMALMLERGGGPEPLPAPAEVAPAAGDEFLKSLIDAIKK